MIPSVSPTGLLTLTSTTYWRPSIFPSDPLAGAGIDEQINSESLGNPRVTGPGVSNIPTIDVGSDPQYPHLAFRVFDTSDSRFTKITQQHTLQLPASGLYLIVGRSSARVEGIINANASVWEMNSSIYWDGTTAATPISFNLSGIQIEVVRGNNYGDTVGAVGASGLTLTYDQALNLNINSQPPGMVINPSTGVISIPAAQTATYQDNPLPQNLGADYAFSGNIFARDAAGNLRGQVEFDNMFDAVGQPGHTPVVNDGTVSGTVGQTITFHFTGSDPDGDPLTWSIVGLSGPGGATPANQPQLLNPTATSVDFSWNTTNSVDGTWLAQVQARDPGGLTDIGDLTINLAPAPQFTPGITVITHGFQTFPLLDVVNPPGWTFTMARAIKNRVQSLPSGAAQIGVYSNDNNGSYREVTSSGIAFNLIPFDPSKENILIFNWASESDRKLKGWAEAAADALFASIVGFVGGINGLSAVPWHFIGHSRGSVINSEVVERFVAFQKAVQHVTNLDPHDFDQLNIGFDEDFKDWELGQPQGNNASGNSWGFTTWRDVGYSDNYFSIDGGTFLGQQLPIGRLAGSKERFVVVGRTASSLNPPPSMTLDHFDVHAWYHGTIHQTAVNDGAGVTIRPDWYPPSATGARAADGWNYSRLGGNANNRPPMVVHSNGVTQPDPRWSPTSDSFFNGSFELFQKTRLQSTGPAIYRYDVPGWQLHGGTGPALSTGSVNIGSENTNDFLVLGKNGRFSHNRFFAPAGSVLKFDYRVDKRKNNSFLTVSSENADLPNPISANQPENIWRPAEFAWPAGVHRLVFSFITNGNGKISIDNVRVEVPHASQESGELAAAQAMPYFLGTGFERSSIFSRTTIMSSAFADLGLETRDSAATDDRLAELV